jgi:hypothetical protein
MKNFKLLPLCACFLLSIAANAQKLPNVQQGSVRAPQNIKIDGKASEWDNQFKAYNHATDIFYTLSNDGENLYLTVQAIDPGVIRKIISGGVCLTIQPSGKKTDKDGMRVVYPVTIAAQTKGMMISVMTVKRNEDRGNAQLTDKEADSVMMARNKQFSQRSKWIGTLGFKDLDSLISVYNEDGIKAAGRYDAKGAFTCELSVNLKLLGLSVDNPAKFSYHVLLNGVSMYNNDRRPDQVISVITTGAPMGGAESSMLGAKMMMDQGGAAPTDFWGEYTLAKK